MRNFKMAKPILILLSLTFISPSLSQVIALYELAQGGASVYSTTETFINLLKTKAKDKADDILKNIKDMNDMTDEKFKDLEVGLKNIQGSLDKIRIANIVQTLLSYYDSFLKLSYYFESAVDYYLRIQKNTTVNRLDVNDFIEDSRSKVVDHFKSIAATLQNPVLVLYLQYETQEQVSRNQQGRVLV